MIKYAPMVLSLKQLKNLKKKKKKNIKKLSKERLLAKSIH